MRAASVGAKPIDPVIPFKTTSQVIAAISVDASGPSITVASGNADLIKSAPLVTPITETLNFFACSTINSGLFPAIDLARRCGTLGGGLPAIFNAANEVCVAAFIEGKIGFTSIIETVEEVVQSLGSKSAGALRDLSDVGAIEKDARRIAQEHISKVAR